MVERTKPGAGEFILQRNYRPVNIYAVAASFNHTMSHELSSLEHVIAGGGAGIIEILVMYPTDVLKTRFQLATGATRPNLAATVKSMLKSDGVGIFYRGIVAPIFSE